MAVKYTIGNVFKMEISDEGYCVYFQYIADDSTCNNFEVVRVFKTIYPPDCKVKPDEIVADEIAFYFHAYIKGGLSIDFWKKFGKSKNLGLDRLSEVWFGSAEPFSLKEIAELPGISAFDANYTIWHVNEPPITIGIPDDEMKEKLQCARLDKGMMGYELYQKFVYGYIRENMAFYNNIERQPRQGVDSFVKYHDRMSGRKHYFHFLGSKAVRELIVEPTGKMIVLTEDRPEVDGYRLYDKSFGSINWRQDEFMKPEMFEELWTEADAAPQGSGLLGRLRAKLHGDR